MRHSTWKHSQPRRRRISRPRQHSGSRRRLPRIHRPVDSDRRTRRTRLRRSRTRRMAPRRSRISGHRRLDSSRRTLPHIPERIPGLAATPSGSHARGRLLIRTRIVCPSTRNLRRRSP